LGFPEFLGNVLGNEANYPREYYYDLALIILLGIFPLRLLPFLVKSC